MDDQTTLPLAINKTVVFYSPLEKEDVTVRTGTLENVSFIHSVLHAYSREYSHLEEAERQHLVDKVYGHLFQLYETNVLQNSKKQTLQHTLEYLTNFFNDKSKPDFEVYEILAEILPLTELETLLHTQENPITAILDKVETILSGFNLEEDRIHYCLKKLRTLLDSATTHAEKLIAPDSLPLNKKVINIMANYLDRDIFCLHFHTRLPVHDRSSDFKKRKTIVVLQLEPKKKNYKYEVVGRLLPGNRVQREFDYKDPFVKRIRIFLYEPIRFAEDYPDLAEYLPSSVYQKSPTVSPTRKSPAHSPYRK